MVFLESMGRVLLYVRPGRHPGADRPVPRNRVSKSSRVLGHHYPGNLLFRDLPRPAAEKNARAIAQRWLALAKVISFINFKGGVGKTTLAVKIVLCLALILILALVPWEGIAGAGATLDEQLISAAQRGDVEQVEYLLGKGADVNAKDRFGQTALMIAQRKGWKEIAKVLRARGAREVTTKSDICFALPFFPTGYVGADGTTQEWPMDLSLADSVEAGNKVALISPRGVCTAKTAYTFHYEHPGGEDFESTLLKEAYQCPTNLSVAMVGVDPTAIRLITPSDDNSAVTKDLQLRARRLLVYCFRQIKRKKVLVVDLLLRGSSEASSPAPASLFVGTPLQALP
ncbi:MAG: hypothetical protein FJ118_06045, partial [Deltaproteobacteria bacterium]|nr:hypothetical protein [Deltaproteobacteria bacterium]